MPVLKVKNNGVWEQFTVPGHTHQEVEDIKALVGEASVAEQINSAISDTYDAESESAMSGRAVAEALSTVASQGCVQSDWNETDETSLAFIKNKPTISADGSLPVPQTASIGQYLQVSEVDENGAITGMAAVDTAASDWETMQNRPFYCEPLFDGVFMFVEGEEVGLAVAECLAGVDLTIGATYRIAFNGMMYTSECVLVDGLKAIGNTGVLTGGSSNDIPFVIGCDAQGAAFGTPLWILMPLNISAGELENWFTNGIPCKIESESAVKYLDNKYLEFMEVVDGPEIMPEQTVTFVLEEENIENPEDSLFICNGDSSVWFPILNKMVAGAIYDVNFDDTKYTSTAIDMSGSFGSDTDIVVNKCICCGNLSICDIGGDTGEPFFIMVQDIESVNGDQHEQTAYIFTRHTSAIPSMSCIVSIYQEDEARIRREYLPDLSDLLGSGSSGSGLPEVTTDDNNKVMTVVDGVWTAQTPASELPTVATSDVGKFLRVNSDGLWVAESITNAEEASF